MLNSSNLPKKGGGGGGKKKKKEKKRQNKKGGGGTNKGDQETQRGSAGREDNVIGGGDLDEPRTKPIFTTNPNTTRTNPQTLPRDRRVGRTAENDLWVFLNCRG